MNIQYSNIITPPDFVEDDLPIIVLIDPAWREVEDLALILKTSSLAFNVYVYRADMDDVDWLDGAVKKASKIIINTAQNNLSPIKDRLALSPIALHYGEKRFLMAMEHKVDSMFDYFVNLESAE